MNRAYLFPFGVTPSPSQAHRATPVNLTTDHATLVQAAKEHRLFCPYSGCLEPVTLVHQEAGTAQLRCFAHLPATAASPLCPYRIYGRGGNGGGPHSSPEHTLRKQIENALHIELQRNLAERGTAVRIESSDYGAAEPCIRITGLGPPLQIRGLAPGCEALWSQPFDGSIDAEEVLFFVVSQDAPLLDPSFIDRHLLARRPAILVATAEGGSDEHTYTTVSSLADHGAARLIATLDLLRVDYRHLLGLDRPAEYLFIPVLYRQSLEEIGQRLAVAGLTPEEGKALRLLAKRLLVDGAAVHSSVFRQSREEAQRTFVTTKTFPRDEELLNASELGRLLENRGLQRFCAERPLLAPLWKSFFSDAFTALADSLNALRKQAKKDYDELVSTASKLTRLAQQLADQKAQCQSSKNQIDRLEKELAAVRRTAAAEKQEAERKRQELDARVEALKVDLEGERRRREGLQHSLNQVNSHRLGHWLLAHYLGETLRG